MRISIATSKPIGPIAPRHRAATLPVPRSRWRLEATLSAVWIAVSMLAAPPALAQDDDGAVPVGEEDEPRVGIGVGLRPSFAGSVQSPIWATSWLLVEPEVSVGWSRATFQGYDASDPEIPVGVEQSALSVELVVGAFVAWEVDPSFRVLLGPRLGLVHQQLGLDLDYSAEADQSGDATSWGWLAGGALGGEYRLSPHFSLGAEAQLSYLHLGEPEVSGDVALAGGEMEFLQTEAEAVFRWYF